MDVIFVPVMLSIFKNFNVCVDIVLTLVLARNSISKDIRGRVSRLRILELVKSSTFKDPRPKVSNEFNYESFATKYSKYFKLAPSNIFTDDSFKFNHLHKPKFLSSSLAAFFSLLFGNFNL